MHILGHYLSQNALRAKLSIYILFGAKSKREYKSKNELREKKCITNHVIAYHNIT